MAVKTRLQRRVCVVVVTVVDNVVVTVNTIIIVILVINDRSTQAVISFKRIIIDCVSRVEVTFVLAIISQCICVCCGCCYNSFSAISKKIIVFCKLK